MIEIYKDIKGYNSDYKVSNFGNVKSFKKNKLIGTILKKNNIGLGYLQVKLYINNVNTSFLVHRLVAEAFIDNPNNYQQVNHINGVKDDNRIDNLEWCTQSENTLHSFLNGLQKVTKPNMMSVIDKISGTLYESISESSRQTGWSVSHLRNMLLNNRTNKTNLEFYEKQ